MTWFRRSSGESGVEPFDRWEMRVQLSGGRQFELTGRIYVAGDNTELVRMIDAMAAGLRDAGFPTEIELIRESGTSR